MKKQIIKYFLICILIILIMTVVGLEIDFDIITYMITYVFVGGFITFVFIRNNYWGVFPAIIVISFIFTYALGIIITMNETDSACLKIESIPKAKLIEFHNTHDIKVIPEEFRRTWVGAFYRKIDIVPSNRVQNIKAVGWKVNSVFAYYDIEEDKYSVSYH